MIARSPVLGRVVVGGACALAAVMACKKDAAPESTIPGEGPQLSQADLMDPTKCRDCHTAHYDQWSGSMHAYAADDPLFLAMNARGQRETNGALGDFCVQCHAPIAVREGLTRNGLDLATVPQWAKGVTCYYCHSVDQVTGAHDDPQTLATDGILRGEIVDPIQARPHAARYAPLQDGDRLDSAPLCGTCHDVQNGAHVDLARTFAEWQTTIFAEDVSSQALSCAACHMPGKDGIVAGVPNAPKRRVHDHSFPAMDVATTPFANTDAQRNAVQANLDPSLVARLCVANTSGTIQAVVSLDDAFAGHAWPSGAAYHRRAWVELTVFASDDSIVYSLGNVADAQSIRDAQAASPTLWVLGDFMKDAAGKPTEMLWTAASIDSALLPPAVTLDAQDPRYFHAITKTFDLPSGLDVAKVRMQVHVRPVDHDFVDDLIASGDLDASFASKLTTFTLQGTVLEWTAAGTGLFNCVPR